VILHSHFLHKYLCCWSQLRSNYLRHAGRRRILGFLVTKWESNQSYHSYIHSCSCLKFKRTKCSLACRRRMLKAFDLSFGPFRFQLRLSWHWFWRELYDKKVTNMVNQPLRVLLLIAIDFRLGSYCWIDLAVWYFQSKSETLSWNYRLVSQ